MLILQSTSNNKSNPILLAIGMQVRERDARSREILSCVKGGNYYDS